MSDLIRRKDVVEALYQAIRTTLTGTFTDSMSLAIAMANNLPSVEPEERTAKVVGIEKPIIGDTEGKTIKVTSCGSCKNVVSIFDNFCPECGCRLIWGDDDEDAG